MLLSALVFVSVFLLAALLIAATGVNASQRVRQILSRLDAVLVPGEKTKEEMVDVRKQDLLSAIPLLHRILLRLEISPRLHQILHQSDVKWTPGAFLLISSAACLLAALLADVTTGALFFSLVLGFVSAAIPLAYVLWKRSNRFLKFEEGLPEALDLMVSGLRGGHSLVSVLGLVSREAPDPIGPEFRICFDEQNYGMELRDAMENLAVRVPVQDVRLIMTAILIQKETGGNLAEILEKCAHVIRERFRLKREIRVKTAQGRLSGWILSSLPVVLAVLLYFMRPDVISLLWTRPLGLKMLYAGAVMIVIGALIIRRIVQIRV
jgi:tight adherence protein B